MYLSRAFLFVAFFTCLLNQSVAQYDAPLYTSYTTAIERAKLHDRLIKNSINKNLSSALSDSTEENWEDAFDALEVLLYKSPLVDTKIHKAFDEVETRSID